MGRAVGLTAFVGRARQPAPVDVFIGAGPTGWRMIDRVWWPSAARVAASFRPERSQSFKETSKRDTKVNLKRFTRRLESRRALAAAAGQPEWRLIAGRALRERCMKFRVRSQEVHGNV